MTKPVSAVIVGAGHRALQYASYAEREPEKFAIVGVAEPSESRRSETAKRFGIPESACFESAEALAAVPRFADAAINGTMDRQHVPTSLPLLAAGYDLLLEKPFGTNEKEMWTLVEAARRHKRKVMICHVLRFAPFYNEIAKRVAAGEIGELTNIQTSEHVSSDHMAVSYVRGKYANEEKTGSSMLLGKCSHDLDLIAWFKQGIPPVRVASFGSRSYFRPEKAPQGAGQRCLVDCPEEVENACLYSARKFYLNNATRRGGYVWSDLKDGVDASFAEKEAWLKDPENPYGRCVYHSDNTVVDRQSLTIEFADGCTATHNLIGGTAKNFRYLSLTGTKGEITGELESNRFAIRMIDPVPGQIFSEEIVDLTAEAERCGSHGGGDLRLVADFVRVTAGGSPTLATTLLENSIYGHLLCFHADRARIENRVLTIPSISEIPLP